MAEATNSGGTFTSDGSGEVAWTNPSRVASSNNQYATAALGVIDTSAVLIVTNFGFSVAGTVSGIAVAVERKGSVASEILDLTANLYLSGSPRGSDKADLENLWPSADTVKTYGGAADLWGTTWTPTQVNDSTFGFGLACYNAVGAATRTASIDHIAITVTYTAAAAGGGRVLLMGVGQLLAPFAAWAGLPRFAAFLRGERTQIRKFSIA